MNIRTLGVFCGILSGFFWGTMDIAAQYLLHTVRMAPAQFISLTMVVTTVALFAISIATKPKETFHCSEVSHFSSSLPNDKGDTPVFYVSSGIAKG